jgi:hypothetical protein
MLYKVQRQIHKRQASESNISRQISASSHLNYPTSASKSPVLSASKGLSQLDQRQSSASSERSYSSTTSDSEMETESCDLCLEKTFIPESFSVHTSKLLSIKPLDLQIESRAVSELPVPEFFSFFTSDGLYCKVSNFSFY